MIIDKNSTFGEELSLSSDGKIGDAIDLGAEYSIGAGANRPPVLHVVSTGDFSSVDGTLQLCTSKDGTQVGDVLISIPIKNRKKGEVLFSGMIPVVPEASGRYLVLNNNGVTAGTISAYILNNAPSHHIYPGK